MEAALVSAATGVIKPLLYKLSTLLGGEYVKLKGVRKQIRFLRDELSAVSATLEVLANAEQLNPEMKEWRDNLRELAYDLEDCIDAFMAQDEDGGPDGRTGFKQYIVSRWNNLKDLKSRHGFASQIEELKASVIEASKRHKRYDVSQLTHNSTTSSSPVDPRLPALYEDIKNLVGIDDPKKHIIKLLDMEMNGRSDKVVSIVGCGGLGKTTLAKQVFDTIKRQFLCTAFVSVSGSPDVRKILRCIADRVKVTDIIQNDDEQQLIDKLREHLSNKRYFVVIDDVWDAKAWEFIRAALPNNDLGSRIVTTTRNIALASSFSSKGGNVYEMKHLGVEDSKRLLFKRAFGSENLNYTHLGSVPDEILRKCDGLPLAIITMASLLADQNAKGEWDRVLNDIGSALAKNIGAEKMTAILSLSYFDFPHHLRTCLLYLSVFPEDDEIEKQHLINRWIAEGFVHEKEGRTKYETGEGYFNDLINRSMIQPVNVEYGQAEACRVHDIILDYIKCKAAEENFITSMDLVDNGYNLKYKVRRLCFYNCNYNEENVRIHPDLVLCHVRSLTLFGMSKVTSFLPFMALRVLDLQSHMSINDHHLESIGKLFHLKYLCLASPTFNKLPEKIGELIHLETLDIRDTGIMELPPAISKLQQLAHLYVDSYVTFPDGVIGQMHGLEELSCLGVQAYEHERKLRQEFDKLTKLKTLEISLILDFSNDSKRRSQHNKEMYRYLGTLLSKRGLVDITIRDADVTFLVSLDSWNPVAPCNLKKLCFNACAICTVPNWMGSLGSLEVLKLWIICVRPEDVEILGAIPSLLFLELETAGGTNGRIIVPGDNGFGGLKYLSLWIYACGTSLEFEAGSIPKLDYLKLDFNAHKIECLNGASHMGIDHLSVLSKVQVKIRSHKDDDMAKNVADAVNAAVETLPNHPSTIIETPFETFYNCQHFEGCLREFNQEFDGELTEWLKIWQIEEEPTEGEAAGQTEQQDETNKEKEDDEAD